ncbi:unnamed protein product, partial [Ixodes hexagonus]
AFGEGNHTAIWVDVRNSTAVKNLFEQVRDKYPDKNLSILVNSAGILHKPEFLVNLTEDAFDDTINTNLKASDGTFLVTREAVRTMLESNVSEAAIVNIASIVGKGGFPTVTAYAASKGGIIAFTKSVALELATSNIRVNVVLPGGTNTPMSHQWSNKTRRDRLATLVPMKRYAEPIEVSEVIVFLCSNKTSYMTGASVDISGGTYM